MKKTHYERLNVSEDTGAGDLYDAWQAEIQRLKAETEPGIGQAVAMAEINESYRLLADRDRRAAYDRKLAAARAEAAPPAPAAPSAPVESFAAPAAPVEAAAEPALPAAEPLPPLEPVPAAEPLPPAEPLPVIEALAEPVGEPRLEPIAPVDVDLPVDPAPALQAGGVDIDTDPDTDTDPKGVRLSDFGDLDTPEGRAAPAPAFIDIEPLAPQSAVNIGETLPVASEAGSSAAAAPVTIDLQEASAREVIREALDDVPPLPPGRDAATLERRPDVPDMPDVPGVVAPLPSWAANEAPAARSRSWAAMAAVFVVGAGLGLFGGLQMDGGRAEAGAPAQVAQALQPKPIQDIAPSAALPATAASGVVTGLDGEPASAPTPDAQATIAAVGAGAAPATGATGSTVVSGSIVDATAPALPATSGASAIDLGNGIIVPPPPRVAREDTGAYRALWLAVAWSEEGHLLDGDTLALPSGWQRGLAKAPAAR